MTDQKKGVGHASGRLDFMGGVADYSGSMVLEMPIDAKCRVEICTLDTHILRVKSTLEGFSPYECDLTPFTKVFSSGGKVEDIRALVLSLKIPGFVQYIVGCVAVFYFDKGWAPAEGTGLEVLVDSNVPLAMGVSSSASLEVATLRALAHLSGESFSGTKAAVLGQAAENKVVGAPCGLMDQLTCAYGVDGHILPIICRPDLLQSPVPVPEGVVILGIPSGVKHSVGGGAYGISRTASFMGKKILEQKTKNSWEFSCEISPSFLARHLNLLPLTLKGAEFKRLYGGVDDPMSEIEDKVDYPVRGALSYPIQENFRCSVASSLLNSISKSKGKERHGLLMEVGELMLQSHEGYTKMGLGAEQCDNMIDALLVLRNTPGSGVYGGRISGGGSGGTIAVLAEVTALPLLAKLRDSFSHSRGMPLILSSTRTTESSKL